MSGVSLGPCQTRPIEISCENIKQLKTLNWIRKKALPLSAVLEVKVPFYCTLDFVTWCNFQRQSLIISAKSSTLDVWQGSEYASGFRVLNQIQ